VVGECWEIRKAQGEMGLRELPIIGKNIVERIVCWLKEEERVGG
jgi:hypothetical protein